MTFYMQTQQKSTLGNTGTMSTAQLSAQHSSAVFALENHVAKLSQKHPLTDRL